MDYKKIVKNRETRIKILRLLSFIPDELMLRIQYRVYMGRKLNLKNPCRFTEKIQWYKLNYRNSIMVDCVDKYEVRKYLKQKGFADILTHDYGVYYSSDQIDLDKLPKSFVLKDTLGGGGTSVIIVKDKNKINWNNIKKKLDVWCSTPIKKDLGREWPYYTGKKHRIFIEEYMDVPNGLDDYKFFCFNGKVEFLYYISNRRLGIGGNFHILDRNFKEIGVVRVGDEPEETKAIRPSHYEEMLQTAEKLSKDFPHVRVDLYEYKEHVKFGEFTFYNASGYMKYKPDEFDYTIGKKFELPEKFGGGGID